MEAHYAGKQITRVLSFAPDDWVFHPTTGLCTRLLGVALDCRALHPITGLCTQRLGFAPDYWALRPTTGQLLGFEPEYWASTRILSFCLNTSLLSEYWALTQLPKSNFRFHYADPPSQSGHGHRQVTRVHTASAERKLTSCSPEACPDACSGSCDQI